jgi:hypothetical protein
MLIVALVLALIGLGALVLAVVTSNELIAWVCIAASAIGVVLLIVDAVRDRSRGDADESSTQTEDSDVSGSEYVEDYPDEAPVADEYDADEYGDVPVADEHDGSPAVDVESRHEQGPDDRPVDEERPKN